MGRESIKGGPCHFHLGVLCDCSCVLDCGSEAIIARSFRL